MRLIDADAVLRIVESYGTTHGTSLGRHSGVADTIYDEIVKLPTIEAESVRYAKWEPLPPRLEPGILCRNIGETDFKPFFSSGIGDRCSECHYHDEFAIFNTKYCPSCGAKMV